MRKIGKCFSFLIYIIAITSILVVLSECESQEKAKEEKMKATLYQIIEEAWNKGNLDILDELLPTDYIYHIPPFPDVEGLEAYKQRIAGYRSAYPDLKITIDEIIVEGDITAMRWTLRGTHTGQSPSISIPPTGKQVTMTGCAFGYWRNGKTIEDWNHANFLGFMQQLGFKLVPPQEVSGK